MSVDRDRAVCNFAIDGDVKGVLEFMQANIPANKLVGVSEAIPQIARLLWSHNSQEPFRSLLLSVTCLGLVDGPQLIASESDSDQQRVDGGSGVAVVSH